MVRTSQSRIPFLTCEGGVGTNPDHDGPRILCGVETELCNWLTRAVSVSPRWHAVSDAVRAFHLSRVAIPNADRCLGQDSRAFRGPADGAVLQLGHTAKSALRLDAPLIDSSRAYLAALLRLPWCSCILAGAEAFVAPRPTDRAAGRRRVTSRLPRHALGSNCHSHPYGRLRQAGIASMMLADVRVGTTRVKRSPAFSRRMRYSF